MTNSPIDFEKIIELTRKIRSEEGCEWSREQTLQTLKPYLIEESFEVIQAIEENNPSHLKEELGDVLYQVILLSQIAHEKNFFSINDVIETLSQKLVHRNPHVFESPAKLTAQEAAEQWHRIKKENSSPSLFRKTAKGLAPLSRSIKLQTEAAKTGFDWPNLEDIYDKIHEEIEEVKEAFETKEFDDVEDEMGDLLFAVTSLARALKVNPSLALERANQKFAFRFEKILEELPEYYEKKTIQEWIELWKNAKKRVTSVD